MDQQNSNDQAIDSKRRRDRGKLIFGNVAVVAVALVYILQLSGAELPDWPDDLPAALAQAKKEDRRVLVFFAGNPASENARNMSRKTLDKNMKHIKRGKFLTVLLQVKKTDAVAKKYSISALPTFLLLDGDGKELNRRTGFVGQAAFHGGFLDCTVVKVKKP